VSTDLLTNVYGKQIDLGEVERAGLTLGQITGIEEISGFKEADYARKYAHGKSLVTQEQYNELPTAMRQLHDWYMSEAKRGEKAVMVKVMKEHYCNGCEICLEFSKLFQLYHMDSIDKSLISCYCL
jgi:hypothetical protein